MDHAKGSPFSTRVEDARDWRPFRLSTKHLGQELKLNRHLLRRLPKKKSGTGSRLEMTFILVGDGRERAKDSVCSPKLVPAGGSRSFGPA